MMLDSYNDSLHDFNEHYNNNADPAARFMVMGIKVKKPDQFKELSEMMQKISKK